MLVRIANSDAWMVVLIQHHLRKKVVVYLQLFGCRVRVLRGTIPMRHVCVI